MKSRARSTLTLGNIGLYLPETTLTSMIPSQHTEGTLDNVLWREQQLSEAMSSLHSSLVAEILDDEYYLTSSQGLQTNKRQAVANLTNRAIELAQFESKVTDSWLLCEHTCLTIGILTVQGHADQEDLTGCYHFAHVWLLRDDTWKLRFVHLTPVAAPELEAIWSDVQ